MSGLLLFPHFSTARLRVDTIHSDVFSFRTGLYFICKRHISINRVLKLCKEYGNADRPISSSSRPTAAGRWSWRMWSRGGRSAWIRLNERRNWPKFPIYEVLLVGFAKSMLCWHFQDSVNLGLVSMNYILELSVVFHVQPKHAWIYFLTMFEGNQNRIQKKLTIE